MGYHRALHLPTHSVPTRRCSDRVLDGEGAVVVDALLARLGRAAGEPVGGVAGRAGAQRDVKLRSGLEALASHDDDVAGSQAFGRVDGERGRLRRVRSEEHTSELQSLMRISYAVFCLKKKK